MVSASRRRSATIPAPRNLHQRGRIRVSDVGPPHPVSWQRRALVKIDGFPKDEIARGDTDQWLLDPGPHVVRVTDSWGRSRDCPVDVPSRRTVDLHCSNHHARTALVKLLPPLWLVARCFPGLTWCLRPASGPALLAAPSPDR